MSEMVMGGGASAPQMDESTQDAPQAPSKKFKRIRVKDPAKAAAKKARKRLKAKMAKGKAGEIVKSFQVKFKGPNGEGRVVTYKGKKTRAQIDNEIGRELNNNLGKV